MSCLMLAGLWGGLAAQNDDCNTAMVVIPASGTVCTSPLASTSAGATQSMPGCTGTADDDVWYQFVATAASHSISVAGSSGYDAVVEVFSGNCSALTSMSCNDFTGVGGIESAHLSGLTPGNTYYFRVYHYGVGWGTGTFTICIIDSPPPPNDDCVNAISLSPTATVCATPITGTSKFATQSMPPCTGDADDDVWYKFVATAISHSLTVTGSANYDAVLELFTGNCGGLTSMVCSDQSNAGGAESIHINSFIVGNTYYFRVYEYHHGSGSDTFNICLITPTQPPPNDDCSGATSLTVATSCASVTTLASSYGATQSMPGCTGTAEDDIWYSFVASYPNETIHVTGLNGADAVVEFFTGTCGSLTSVACVDQTGHNQTELVYPSGLTVGQTYYFRIYDYYINNGDSFTVAVTARELVASASSTLICAGQSVTLSASGTPTYTWSSGVVNGVPFTPTATATYTVSGIGTGGCLNTDSVRVFVSVLVKPDICMVTVDTNNVNNVIYWEKNYANADSFIVYREVLANVYHRIGAVSHTAFSRFVDTARSIGYRNGNPNVRSYRYKLQIRDTCGNYSALSNYHTSLFLNNTGNVFTWNFYDIEGQASPVTTYELYRDDNNTGAFNLLGTVPGTTNTYTDAAFASFPNARWAVMGNGFSCNPTQKTATVNNVQVFVNKTKGNIKNNITIPDPPADPAGINEQHYVPQVKLMPNPASQFVDIEVSLPAQNVRIYNYLGEAVYEERAHSQTHVRLDLQGLSNGLYSVELSGTAYKVVRKLQVSR